jgi:hypothetical protein
MNWMSTFDADRRMTMEDDPRLAAARYRSGRDDPEAASHTAPPAADADTSRTATASDRAAYVENAIQQAIRRGEFEGLPGAGKPLEGLGENHDPDWWIRRKIEREQLRGLGPPALMLRVENRELDDRLDALSRESDVRETLEDFNRRVRLARMQLLGGPPVVTPLRDVDVEVAAWNERRTLRAADRESPHPQPQPRRRRWRSRRRDGDAR